MNWDAVGAIAESLGALGVVATLIYVAVQIRQNTRAIRAASFQASTDSLNHVNTLIAQNKDLARIYTRVRDGESDFDEVEETQFAFIILAVFRVWEAAYYQRKEGVALEQSWQRYDVSLRRQLTIPAVVGWWKSGAFGFTGEFSEYVNSAIHEQPPADDDDV